MSRTTAELLREALELSDEERAGLVVELLDSLGPQPGSEQRSDEAWIAEVERRARAAIEGSPAVSWDEARSQIKDRLGSR